MNSINRTARLAGLLHILTIPVSVFGIVYVPSVLIVPGDALTTTHKIVASEGLFRAAIVAFLLGQTIYLVLPLPWLGSGFVHLNHYWEFT